MFMRRKRLVAVTLLLAALASYADLPRLHLATSMGDVLNVARVLDPVQCARIQQELASLGDGASELAADLNDGQQSLALVQNAPLIQAVIPSRLQLPTFKLADSDDRPTFSMNDFLPLTALGGSVLALDLPPPSFHSHTQPPRLQLPFDLSRTHTARAPPLSLR